MPAGVAVVEHDRIAWLAASQQASVRLEGFPLGPSRSADLNLIRVNPLDGATVVVASMAPNGIVTERVLHPAGGQIWTGHVDGEPESIAIISHGEHFTYGYIESSSGTSIVSSGPVGSGRPTVAFTLQDLAPDAITWATHACQLLEPPADAKRREAAEGGVAGDDPCRQARIAIETDTEFLARFGGNVTAASDYVATLFAASNLIYVRDVSLRPNLAYLRLWTGTTDPWNTSSSSAALPEFRDYWQSAMGTVPRAMAHMLSGRGLGGGIAWLGSVCGSFSYAVSGNLAGSFPYPVADNNAQNWDLMVFAHEMGHNLGSPHTHDHSPPADGCGLNPADCTAADLDEGTIMSYCHLCSGGMTNMRMRFHERSVASMLGYLGSIACDITGPTEPPAAMADRFSVSPPVTVDLDILANDIPFNCETVSIATIVSDSPNATFTILPGAGPEGRDLVRAALNIAPGAQVRASYRLIDSTGWWSLTTPITIDAPLLRTPENPTGTQAGVDVAYYVLTAPEVLPDFSALSPYLTSSASQVDLPSTGGNFADSGRAEDVGALFTGWIDVPSAGEWQLFTTSDDGSRLWIGDTIVVNNDGLHPMVEAGGTILLAPGRHKITVAFFERGGGAGLIVSWQGPGTPKQVIPASRWSRGGVVNWADVDRNSVVNALDLAAVLAAWGSPTGGLADTNGDLQVDGKDLAVVLAGWTG